MYIKLNFSGDMALHNIFRIVNEIINTSGITSIATLQSTGASWYAPLLATLVPSTSEIIRTGTGVTGLTSNTVSRYSKGGSLNGSYEDQHHWSVEFSRYDDTSKKYYVYHFNTSANNNATYLGLAGGLSSGTFSSVTNMAPTVSSFATSSVGTVPTYDSTAYGGGGLIASSGSGYLNVRSFFMYISDTAMVWSATLGTSTNLGFTGTYSSSNNYIGPFIYSQYTRFDYTNTNTNSVVPLLFTNSNRGAGIGFGGTTSDWTAVENNQYNTTSNAIAFRVFNLVNSYPTTSASFPIIAQPYVNWGIGSRYTDYAGLTATGGGSTSVAGTAAYGPVIFNTVSVRYPSADLKSQSFGMLPVTWRNLYYYNAGGDASAKGGWYCFNGDYFPGDEYTYGGKTYKILPTYVGYSQRVGIAIPKE